MAILKLDRAKPSPPPPSGGAMDRAVAKRGLSTRVKIGIGAALLLATASGIYWFAPSAGTQSVAADRVTISPVTKGVFEDFLPLRSRVTPLVTVFLDSIEGGRVEKILVDDGAAVQKGQLIAVLSNAELQLSVLARQTEVTQQLNSMRSQELALEQNRLRNARDLLEADLAAQKIQRQFDREKALAEKGFVAGRAFADTSDDLAYQQRRRAILARGMASDERLQTGQLAQLRSAAKSMESSLAYARGNLDALNLRAPVAGKLSSFSIQVGQSLARGERLGQIDSPGANKLIAGVDEFYLGRVQLNQQATATIGGRDYALRVTKISPQVRNGQFEIDLQFKGTEPTGIQRGQTLQARLVLGDPAPARLIPNGSFYNDTGGSWVFVVSANGRDAIKRPVRLGRRNADFIEVLDGLDVGERVLTSPYTGFADKDRLDLTRN